MSHYYDEQELRPRNILRQRAIERGWSTEYFELLWRQYDAIQWDTSLRFAQALLAKFQRRKA